MSFMYVMVLSFSKHPTEKKIKQKTQATKIILPDQQETISKHHNQEDACPVTTEQTPFLTEIVLLYS